MSEIPSTEDLRALFQLMGLAGAVGGPSAFDWAGDRLSDEELAGLLRLTLSPSAEREALVRDAVRRRNGVGSHRHH